jgi:hypothetical protein
VAQLVADWLRRRHETRVLARNDRRDAYATFLSAASAALAPIAANRNEFQRQIMPPDFWPERSVKALMSAQEVFNALGVGLARVYLVAPADTHGAAAGMQAAIMKYMFKDEKGMAEALAEAQEEFMRLARRDLG